MGWIKQTIGTIWENWIQNCKHILLVDMYVLVHTIHRYIKCTLFYFLISYIYIIHTLYIHVGYFRMYFLINIILLFLSPWLTSGALVQIDPRNNTFARKNKEKHAKFSKMILYKKEESIKQLLQSCRSLTITFLTQNEKPFFSMSEGGGV